MACICNAQIGEGVIYWGRETFDGGGFGFVRRDPWGLRAARGAFGGSGEVFASGDE